MTTQTLFRTAVILDLESSDDVSYIEELLWTLEGVESVGLKMDGEEHLEGIEVIGTCADLCDQIKALFKECGLENQVSIRSSLQIKEEDWAESWKRYWYVNRVLPNLVIQPSWEPFAPLSDDIVLKLDPGSAFGTGTHETTQLMLFLLKETVENRQNKPLTLLDVGTGSGILAIYGAKLGIKECKAVDNDPLAVEVTCSNSRINGVEQYIDCTGESLSDITNSKFDIVLANILSSVLREMMPDLRRVLAEQGVLILSGIIREQYSEMAESIKAEGMIIQRLLQKGNWLALVCSA